MNLPTEEMKSRSDFDTDASFQSFYRELFRRYRLDDGFSYLVNLLDGRVTKGSRMKLEAEKLSKSVIP